jgi:hypothetical protein
MKEREVKDKRRKMVSRMGKMGMKMVVDNMKKKEVKRWLRIKKEWRMRMMRMMEIGLWKCQRKLSELACKS